MVVEMQAAGWFGDPLGQTNYPYPNAQPVNFGFVQLYQAYVTVEGGTFDFTVLKLSESGYEVLGRAGDAWLGGELTRIDVEGFPPLPIYFVWMVRDNGQGAASVSDQVGPLLISLNPNRAATCTMEPVPDPPVPLTDLTNGNIKVN